MYGIVAHEMLTNHSEQIYGKINDCIIPFTHLILGWKYVVHLGLKSFVSIHRTLGIITVNIFSRNVCFTIDRTLPIIVFAIKRIPTSYRPYT